MVQDLEARLNKLREALHGCESLSVASNDGFVLATTHQELRQGEFLAAVTSVMLASCTRGLAPFKAGQCRALDFRGDRQVLISQLPDLRAYLVCVLHPGAQAINIDEPMLRAFTVALPAVLHGEDDDGGMRFFLQRDKDCMIPIRRGFVIGRATHCDLCIPHADIDEEHVRFELLGQELLCRDLDTRNGTKLNMRQFEGTASLKPGDRLTLPRAGGFNIVGLTAAGKVVKKRRKSRAS